MSTTDTDSEKADATKEFHAGFADFAEYIARDNELSLYKGFASLTARNLLYLQAELQVLGKELCTLDEEDEKHLQTAEVDSGKIALDAAARSWEAIMHQCKAGNEHEIRRMSLILKIRKPVKEYEKALLRRSQVLSLESPDHGTKEALFNWFRYKKPLRGCGWHLIDDEKDIIALKSTKEPDRLTSIIKYCFGYYLRDRQNTSLTSWGPMYYFNETAISRIVGVIAVIVAAFFLIGAIMVLYFVNNVGRRLGIVSVFTVSFAATVGLLTNAKRAEIFASTAAYAAVLVVFVSGNISRT